jgi:aminoglycoside phosphotransferase (APT) family kinase protein
MRPGGPRVEAVAALARAIFPPTQSLAVARMAEGVATYVYRIGRGDERFYLRVLPEVGYGFAPELRVHALLRERGVSVPEVLYFEHRNETFGMSVLVTTELAGSSVARAGLGARTPEVLAAAGRDLAIINSLPVAGFGWVRRDAPLVTDLAAELPTNRAFLTEYLESDLAFLGTNLLNPAEVAAVRATLARYDAWLDAEQGQLAHGDLDATHIFQQDERYAGIIDFGEIRGTDPWYDLGHFAMRDGELLPTPMLPWLLEGYATAAPLPDDHRQRIAFASLLIGIRTAARVAQKGRNDRSALQAIRRGVAALQV